MKSVAAVVPPADEALRPGFLPGAAAPAQAGPAPTPPRLNDLEPTIYRFVLKYSSRQQILLLLFTLLSFPFLYYSLELPKTIVNHAIREEAKLPQSIFALGPARVLYLMALSVIFLMLVLVTGAFKYYINTFKVQMGERMLRRFRYKL